MTDRDRAAEEAETLNPDITQTIAGRQITMREPTWLESLDLEHLIQPIVDDITEKLGDEPFDRRSAFSTLFTQVTAKHRDAVIELMAFCADLDPKWIRSLGDGPGMDLMILFWRVNWHFFARRLNLSRGLAGLSARGVGAKSSPH